MDNRHVKQRYKEEIQQILILGRVGELVGWIDLLAEKRILCRRYSQDQKGRSLWAILYYSVKRAAANSLA